MTILVVMGFVGVHGERAVAQKVQDGRMMLQMAQQLEMSGRWDQAADFYARAARSQENQRDIGPYLNAKRCWLQTKNLGPWKALIIELQSKYRDLQFEVDLAEIEYLEGEQARAIKRWRDMIVNNPTNDRAYLLVGAAFLEYQLFADAQWMYERGRKAFKEGGKFFFELVRIYQAQGEYRKMCQEYAAFLRINPLQIGFVQSQLLSVTSEEGLFLPVVQALEYLLKNEVSFIEPGHRILAALFTQNGQYQQALNHYTALERLMAEQKKPEQGHYYFSFATVAMNDGAFAEAREALERIISQQDRANPLRIRAAFAKAQVLEKEKNYAEAIQAYEAFIVEHSKWADMLQVLTRLATLHFDVMFNISKAEETYQRILHHEPLPVHYRLMAVQKLAECAIARGEWTTAQKQLHQLKQESPVTTTYHQQAELMLAELALYRGDSKTALENLSRQLQGEKIKTPTSIDTVQNNIIELYLFLRENQQDSAGLALIGQAKWLQKQRRYAEAFDTLAAHSQPSKNPRLHEEVSFLQINLLRQMNRYAEALGICQALVQEPFLARPDLAMMIWAEIHESMSDSQQAQQIYESFLEKYPQSIYIEQVRVRIRQLEKSIL